MKIKNVDLILKMCAFYVGLINYVFFIKYDKPNFKEALVDSWIE